MLGQEVIRDKRHEDSSLQCPSSCEPTTLHERTVSRMRFLCIHIDEIRITDGSVTVPPEHGVHGLRKLSTAAFVDATCISPTEPIAILPSNLTAPLDLLIAKLVFTAAVENVLERNFLGFPRVRENCVWWWSGKVLVKFQSSGIQEPHAQRALSKGRSPSCGSNDGAHLSMPVSTR
jgi:hypothetical protein